MIPNNNIEQQIINNHHPGSSINHVYLEANHAPPQMFSGINANNNNYVVGGTIPQTTNSMPVTYMPPPAMPPTSMPSTAMPSTAMPPTAMPPTAMPPTSMQPPAMPPTSMPTTSMPPTSMPPTAMPPTTMPPAPMPPQGSAVRHASDASYNEGKIFIGGLNYDVTNEILKEFFTQHYGPVLSAEVMRDRATNMSRGFGFVIFENQSEVERAVQDSPFSCCGTKVDIRRAEPKTKQAAAVAAGLTPGVDPLSQQRRDEFYGKVFIGGLAFDTDKQQILEYFGKSGRIKSIEMLSDKVTGQPRGFCFLTFEDHAVAESVQGRHPILSKSCEVKLAVPKGKLAEVEAQASKTVHTNGVPTDKTSSFNKGEGAVRRQAQTVGGDQSPRSKSEQHPKDNTKAVSIKKTNDDIKKQRKRDYILGQKLFKTGDTYIDIMIKHNNNPNNESNNASVKLSPYSLNERIYFKMITEAQLLQKKTNITGKED